MSQNLAARHPVSKVIDALGLSAWVALSLFGLSTAVLWIIFQIIPQDWVQYLVDSTPGLLFLTALQYVITLLIAVGLPLMIRRWSKREAQELKHVLGIAGSFQIKHALIVPIVWAVYFLTSTIAAIIAAQVPGFDVNQAQEIGFQNLTGATDLILAFIGLVILAPIAEELLFRGYLFGKIRAFSSFWWAAIVVSLVFGIVHLQWNVGVDTFVLSIFLCWLREKTGTVWASVLLHGLKNGIAYFFLFIAPLLGLNILN